MENIETVKAFVHSLNNSVGQLDSALLPVLNRSLDELIAANTETPVERIALYNNYLYTLISVLYSHLKAVGTKTEEHPIMKELTRIKAYMKRLKDYEALLLAEKVSRDILLEKSKAYIENTLGLAAVNGGGAAQTQSLLEPAISKVHFQGTHTKFDDKSASNEGKSARAEEKTGTTPKSAPRKPTASGKVAKPAKAASRAKKARK